MNTFKKNLIRIFIICSICSCSSDTKVEKTLASAAVVATEVANDGNSLIVCDLSMVKDSISIYLDDYFYGCEIIPLDNGEEALVKSDGHSVVSEHYIGIYSSLAGGYKLFDTNGRFIKTLSSKGNAPNEYLISIYDSYINETSNSIYLLPMMGSRIFVYNLEGDEQPFIPLAYKAGKGKLKPNAETKEIAIGVLPFTDTQSVFWIQDEAGNITKEIGAGHLAINPPDYSNEIDVNLNTPDFDLALFHWVPTVDSLYHYDETTTRLRPVFTITFRNDDIPQHEYIELPEQYLIRMYEPESPLASTVIVDKRSLRGAYVKFKIKGLGGIEIPSGKLNFKNGFYWANLYSFEMQQEIERILTNPESIEPEVKDKLHKLLGYINGDNNNIILKGRLKNKDNEEHPVFTMADLPTNRPKKLPNSTEKEEDDKLYLFNDRKQRVPALEDGKKYFKENNVYKDWDINNKKEVRISYIVEKDGTASNVAVMESSGIEDLDKEAVRLIKNAYFLPGLNMEGKVVRCGDMQIIVYFPPLPL